MNKNKSEEDADKELFKAAQERQEKTLHSNLNVNNDLQSNNNDEFEAVRKILSQRPDLLEPVGIVPGKKGDGITRLYYENQDGLSTNMSDGGKVAKAKEILDEMEVDCYCFNEHNLNLLHKENRRRGLGVLFNGGESLIKCVGGSNKHVGDKFVGKYLPGGTGMVAHGTLASLMKSDLSGMDVTGLARWSYMTFVGKEGFITTILVGYNPCSSKNNKNAKNTVYVQHSNYLTLKEKDTTCPRT